jgi:hypothetical protein
MDSNDLIWLRKLGRARNTEKQRQKAIEIAKERGILIGRDVIMRKTAWAKLLVEDLKIEFFWP